MFNNLEALLVFSRNAKKKYNTKDNFIVNTILPKDIKETIINECIAKGIELDQDIVEDGIRYTLHESGLTILIH